MKKLSALFLLTATLTAISSFNAKAEDTDGVAAPLIKKSSANTESADKVLGEKSQDYTITLDGDKFVPDNLVIPANEKIVITVKNNTDKPAEFESSDLDREKVVGAKSDIIVNVGPLKAGTYEYVNDYHEETKGTITAK